MNPDPKCTTCAERAGVVYINGKLTCSQCARKLDAARRYVTNQATPPRSGTPRSWTKTFKTVDDRRQYHLDQPDSVDTRPPVARRSTHIAASRSDLEKLRDKFTTRP